ncbi:conserved hypothetical protein [Verticillium alfalfae VaMs.102]|uniref:Trichothecene 3-O-acetyltransferase n=1 Tax=Verticillium alfalfae (strain VaMs.102 / ATCC MYA-4576 / FGSC 10136) TaxID=526221 RepID=C9SEM5_VERA1|nr:conserved hypothetical protein [Verticillium alfalfae VaMs.102]EEY16618.1 conserved hypothetical protein [Verticillium alfalfae VaMs.102]
MTPLYGVHAVGPRIIRHDLGHYRSAAVTATYTVNLPCQLQKSVWLRNTFERALQYTILGNPGLCFGIEKSGSKCTAGFKQLAEIQSGDVVKYFEIDVVHVGVSVDDHLSRVIGAAHSHQWVAGKPAWRTIVSYQASTKSAPGAKEAETSRVTINVTFLAHHAIADGLSGMAFHMSLMSHLGEVPEVGIEAAWPLSLPHDVPAPASIDHLLGLHDISDNVSEEVVDPVWAGGAILLPSTTEDTSRVRLITISNDRLLEILDVCKRNRTTLTGLLHGLICVTLLRHVEDARAFRSVTSYSIRKFTDADAMDIVNHISFITQYVPSAVLDELQATKTGSPAESCLILKMASAFGAA